MYPQSPKSKLKYSDITSIVDGQVLGDMIKVWKDTAVSDSRLSMIAELKQKNIGFSPLNGDVSDSQLNARGGQNDHALKYI